MAVDVPSPALLRRPKSALQHVYDFVGAPLRLAVLPDAANERLGLTSLRAERFSIVLPELHGRVIDIGAGDNALLKLYARHAPDGDVAASVGVDVHDLGAGCVIVKSSAELPFPDASFHCACFIACLNHIPERSTALREAHRVLRPGGRVIVTMIGRLVGAVGHAIWWYSEDKHRHVDEDEAMGLNHREVLRLLNTTGFEVTKVRTFVYGLNRLYVAERA